MEVLDFLSTYPNIGTGFEEEIFHLKEFYDERLPAKPEPITAGLLKHQKAVARFLSPMTPYRGLLMFHEVGTGKTCAAFAIAEANKSIAKKTFFLSPSRNLNNQQKRELVQKCFPNKYFTTRKIPGYVFATPQTLGNIAKRKSDTGIYNDYSNSVFIIDEVHKLKPRENYKKVKDEIKSVESTISKIKNQLAIADDKDKKELEVGLRRLQSKKNDLESQTVQAYKILQKIFEVADNIKVVLLTATPMTDQASEIIDVMNLLLPQPLRLKKDDWKDPAKMRERMLGRISYLKAPEQSTRKVFIKSSYRHGKEVGLKNFRPNLAKKINSLNINIVACVMSEIQTKVYLEAWCDATYRAVDRKWVGQVPTLCAGKPAPKKQNTLAYDAEQASLLIVPISKDKFVYGNRIQSGRDKKRRRGGNRPGSISVKKFLSTLAAKAKKQSQSLTSTIYEFAPKYAITLEKLNEGYNEGKKAFVYTRAVKGGGANAFKQFLEFNGYSDVTVTKSFRRTKGLAKLPQGHKKRFIFFTGETTVDKAQILRVFNHPKNATGKYIQVLVGTDTITQGYTIKDIQQMHVHDPPWNYATLEQAIGRVVRRDSHKAINKVLGKEAEVRIFLYAGIPNLKSGVGLQFLNEQKSIGSNNPGNQAALEYWNSIDLKKYSKMMEKDTQIKRIERIMKEVAFDCPIFYARNSRPNALDNSRDCEYSTCKYTCQGVDMKEVAGWGTKTVDIIPDPVNYDLFYNSEEIGFIKNILIRMFAEVAYLTFDGMKQVFPHNTESTILNALDELITQPGKIRDRYGLTLSLIESDGIYYVGRSLNSEFTGQFPQSINTESQSQTYIENLGNNISALIVCGQNLEKVQKLIEVEKPLVKELLIENAIVALENEVPETMALALVVQQKLRNKILTMEVDGQQRIISEIMKPCYRCLVEVKDSPRSPTFCGNKVSWSPQSWKDCDIGTVSEIGILKEILAKALSNKELFIAWDITDPVLLDLSDLYPEGDVSQLPSVKNLPQNIGGTGVDTRRFRSGQKFSSLNRKRIKSILKKLGLSVPKTSQSQLVKIILATLKKKKLWSPRKIKVRPKNLLNIFQEVCP